MQLKYILTPAILLIVMMICLPSAIENAFGQTEFSMALIPGINLISVPLDPDDEWRMSDLLAFIGPEALQVIYYDTANSQFRSYLPSYDVDAPLNALVRGGEGYILVMSALKAITFEGNAWQTGIISVSPVIPSEDEIFSHITTIVDQGIRRPGYPADQWAENYIEEQFKKYGLDYVHKEQVTHHGKDYGDEPEVNLKWVPLKTSLIVYNEIESVTIPAFSVPLAVSTDDNGLDLEIVPLESQKENPAAQGKIALYPVKFTDATSHFFLKRVAEWYYDPDNSFMGKRQPPVASLERKDTMKYAIGSGAAGYIGVITNNPDPDMYEYHMPSFGESRPIPGVYISEESGEKIRALMQQQGTTRAKLISKVSIEPFVSHNIIGTLEGKSDDWVIVSGHHDGNFYGAVEGGSSTAVVLAQAEYWAQVPEDKRPHNMLFLITSGHVCGVTGGWSFPREHQDLLNNIVLEISLQNIALEYERGDGKFVPTGKSQARFWFTSQSETLMHLVKTAIITERIDRSYIFKPDTFNPETKLPNSDGAFFYKNGVPIVNLVSSPAYLFTSADTLEKVDKGSLVPVTKAVISIINALDGISAAQLRSE